MKNQNKQILYICATLLFFVVGVAGQSNAKSVSTRERSVAASIVTAPVKVAVVIVGSATKAAWVTTKFVGKRVAGPVAKTVFLKAAPKMAVFAFKQTAKRAVPLVIKLGLL